MEDIAIAAVATGVPSAEPTEVKRKPVPWKLVDWRRQDIELARGLGVTRECVRVARKRHGGGVVASSHRCRTGSTVLSDLLKMGLAGIRVKTLPELSSSTGWSIQSISEALRGMGWACKKRPRGNSKYDWGKFPTDWELKTDKEIALEMGVGLASVVTMWRNRHGFRRFGRG